MSSTPVIAISGATGSCGLETVNDLRGMDGIKVRALVRDVEKAKAVIKPADNIEFAAFDFDGDEASQVAALRGASRFLLVIPGTDRIGMAKKALNSAKLAGVEFVVYLGGVGTGHTAPMSFSRQHAAIQDEIIRLFPGYCFLQLNYFADNFYKYVKDSIKNTNGWDDFVGDARTAFVAVKDIAAVAAQVLAHPDQHNHKTYQLTGPAALTEAECAEFLSAGLGRKITYRNHTKEEYRELLRKWGLPDQVAEFTIEVEQGKLTGVGAKVTGDVKKVTGREATPFKDWAKEYANEFSK